MGRNTCTTRRRYSIALIVTHGSIVAGKSAFPVGEDDKIGTSSNRVWKRTPALLSVRRETRPKRECQHGVGAHGRVDARSLAGIGVAFMFWKEGDGPAMARALPGHRSAEQVHVDELYDRTIVQPIKAISSGVLWRVVDAGLIDGTVNAVGLVVRGWSAVLRRLQTGSLRAYAMSLFLGVVVILGYYLWR